MGSIDVHGAVTRPGPIEVSPGPISDVLDRARPDPDAAFATVISADGYRASIPVAMLHTGGVVSAEPTGLRLHVVDGSTLCWNVKNVAEIEFSRHRLPDDVPEKPQH